MIANIAVYPEVDASLAAQLLQRAEGRTWRQYVLLAAVGRADEHPLPTGTINTRATNWLTWGARFEFKSLYEGHFFTAPPSQNARRHTVPNAEISDQRLSSQGRLLHALLDLDEISLEETADVCRQLAVEPEDPPSGPATTHHGEHARGWSSAALRPDSR